MLSFLVDLGRIELPTRQCECRIIPLYYRPFILWFPKIGELLVVRIVPTSTYQLYVSAATCSTTKHFIQFKKTTPGSWNERATRSSHRRSFNVPVVRLSSFLLQPGAFHPIWEIHAFRAHLISANHASERIRFWNCFTWNNLVSPPRLERELGD